MRAFLVFSLAGILSVVAQTTLLPRLRFLPAPPDLIVVLCVYLGLYYHSMGGAVGAFLLGYLLDTFSGAPPGLYCLAMTLAFAMVYLVSQRLWVENPVTSLAAVGVGCGVKALTVGAYFGLVAPQNVAWLPLVESLVVESLLAVLISPVVFSLLDGYLRWQRVAKPHAGE
jgi:rod shape-determining protein MreD